MEDCFQQAALNIRKVYMSSDDSLTMNSVIDISVGYDGTWHRRGFSSHYGVGTIIELKTGLVLDVHIMSNLCTVCEKGPKKTDKDYGTQLISQAVRKIILALQVAWRLQLQMCFLGDQSTSINSDM